MHVVHNLEQLEGNMIIFENHAAQGNGVAADEVNQVILLDRKIV
jgi:hypothetical protein